MMRKQPKFGKMAVKLEGITRNTGKHAGGVVIAPTKLTDFSPVQCDDDGHNLVTQYDKDEGSSRFSQNLTSWDKNFNDYRLGNGDH